MSPYGSIHTGKSEIIYHSNAYLIPRKCNRVSTIYLYLANGITAADVINSLEAIEFGEFDWSAVTALYVTTDTLYQQNNQEGRNQPEFTIANLDGIGIAIEWIFKVAPRISSVKLGSRSNFVYPDQLPLQNAIFNNIARLNKLEVSTQFLSLSMPPVLPPLTVLAISPTHSLENHILTRIDPRHLRTLTLNHIQPSHFYEAFGIEGITEKSPLVFPELRAMFLYFCSPQGRTLAEDDWFNKTRRNRNSPMPVLFPKLSLVSIHNHYYNITGIFDALLPSPLDVLRLAGHPQVLDCAELHRFKNVRKMWINVECGIGENMPDEMLNRLLLTKMTTIDLTVCSTRYILGHTISKIELESLRYLDLELILRHDQISSILKQLTKLIRLKCIVDVLAMDFSVPEQSILETSKDVCSNTVQHMDLTFYPRRELLDEIRSNAFDQNVILAYLLSLIARVPSLLHLQSCFSEDDFGNYLAKSLDMEKYADIGRHLKHLKYTKRSNI
ncbi:hypothetical protein GGI07_002457 [Coemansia sp. Benny D115]|nr:hypothetical protein GGI07_002457 [Coemansia sp. Benny D115]